MSMTCARKPADLMSRVRPASKQKSADHPGGDELRDLAETFGQTVQKLSSLVHQLEQAHQHTLRVEAEKKQFYREVIRAVTQGKLELVDAGEIPSLGEVVDEAPVEEGSQYAPARKLIEDAACGAEMDSDRVTDLLLAAGEAITNAMKHATGGCCTIYCTAESILVRVSDRGTGIRSEDIPSVILVPGFSTKVSLGMGYTLMLKLCDRVWLATGPEGTTVQLEMRIRPAPAMPAVTLDTFKHLIAPPPSPH